MDKVTKWIALLLAGVMMSAALFACGGEAEDKDDEFAEYANMKPSELYEALLEADEYEIALEAAYAAGEEQYTMEQKLAKNDEVVKMENLNVDGSTDLCYYDFDESLIYAQNSDGVWSVSPIDSYAVVGTLEELVDTIVGEELFEDDYYEAFDEDSGRYVMKEAVAQEHDCESLYIKVNGASYLIRTVGTLEGMTVDVECEIEFKSTKVSLPLVDDDAVIAVTTTAITAPATTTVPPVTTKKPIITTPPAPEIVVPSEPDDWTLMAQYTDWHYKVFYCPTLYGSSAEGTLYDPEQDEMAAWIAEKGEEWYNDEGVLAEMATWDVACAPLGDRYDGFGEGGSPIGWADDYHGLICYTTFELSAEEMSWVEMADINDIYMDVWYDNTFYIWINGTLVYFHDGEGAPQADGGADWNDALEPVDFMDGVDIREILKEGPNEVVVSLKDGWGGREFIMGLECIY
ncbi:MAG: hypothetical protein IJX76_05145 [Clostridia bacterium]|nr:hypothetical protein [Clostridia bacterium]